MRQFDTPIYRRKGFKPLGVLEIDWGHPLSQGLAAYIPLTGNPPFWSGRADMQDIPWEAVSRSRPDSGMTISPTFSTSQNNWIITDLGVQFHDRRFMPMLWQGSAAGPWATWSDSLSRRAGLILGAATELTVAVIGVQGAVVGSAQDWFAKRLSGVAGGGWFIGKDSASQYSFGFNESGGGEMQVTSGALTVFEPVILVGRLRYPLMELWVYHVNTTVDSGLSVVNEATEYFSEAATLPPSDTTTSLNFGPRTGAGNRVSLGPAALWQRGLSLSEIESWIDDPWQMLTAGSTRRFFLVQTPSPTAGVPGIERGFQYNNFLFAMRTSAGVGKTGLVDGDFTEKLESIDGAAVDPIDATITEVSNGFYRTNLTAAETNGVFLGFRFGVNVADVLDTYLMVKTNTASDIGIRRGVAYSNFLFAMRDTNGDPVTGKVDGDFTKKIIKDAGGTSDLTGTITEVSNGWYALSALSATETDATFLGLVFKVAGAVDNLITIKTDVPA